MPKNIHELKILHEDDDLLVLDKPSGIVVNISETSPTDTVQNWVQDYLGLGALDTQDIKKSTKSDEGTSEFKSRCGIVHRLDKGTSGVLLVAKTENNFKYLQRLFKRRKIEKEYIALVFGAMVDEIYRIDAPLKRDPKNRMKFAVSKNGKSALTKVEKINELTFEDKLLSLVKVYPMTGRTHQIRVHMCALDHPIVGDDLYSGANRTKWAHSFKNISRLMLHAHKIKVGNKWYESKLPSNFDMFLSKSNEKL